MLSQNLLQHTASRNRRFTSPITPNVTSREKALLTSPRKDVRGRSQSLFLVDSDESDDADDEEEVTVLSRSFSKSPEPSSTPRSVVPAGKVTMDLAESQKSKKELDAIAEFSKMTSRRASLQTAEGSSHCHSELTPKKKKIKVEVHHYTEDPTVAWEMVKSKYTVKLVRQMQIDSPIRKDALRFICISDTHARLVDPKFIPNGDVLLVAGDFTTCGAPEEIKAFSKLLGKLSHTYKIVIAGNHELTFDPNFRSSNFDKNFQHKSAQEISLRKRLQESLGREKISDPRNLLKNCIYLEDGLVEISGITIYGTPWQPLFDNWAFNQRRGQPLLDKWNRIPSGIDVLLTHTPPLGYGCTTDGYTKFINACICDTKLQPANHPILFDITLPVGMAKKSAMLQPAKVSRRNSSV